MTYSRTALKHQLGGLLGAGSVGLNNFQAENINMIQEIRFYFFSSFCWSKVVCKRKKEFPICYGQPFHSSVTWFYKWKIGFSLLLFKAYSVNFTNTKKVRNT